MQQLQIKPLIEIEEANRTAQRNTTMNGGERKRKRENSKNTTEVSKQKEEESTSSRLNLAKHLKPSARFYPGHPFDLSKWLIGEVDKNTYWRLEQKVNGVKLKIRDALTKHFGCADIVTPDFNGKSVFYKIRCPVEQCLHKTRSLESHLIHKHKWDRIDAKKRSSYIIKTVKHMALLNKHKSYKPDVCAKCNRYVTRVDMHLINYHNLDRYGSIFEGEKKASLEARLESVTNANRVASTEQPPEGRNNASRYYPNSRRSTMTRDMRLRFGLKENENLIYCYKSSEDLLFDFEEWLVKSCSKSTKNSAQIISSVTQIWRAVDKTMSLTPNLLKDPENIEYCYLIPQLDVLKSQQDLPKDKQLPHFKATTLQSKLHSIVELFKYCILRSCYIGLDSRQMEIVTMKVKQIGGLLKPYRLHREQQLKDWKDDNLITPADCLKYGSSSHVQGVIKLLGDVEEGVLSPKCLKTTEVTNIRNYLMVILTIINGARASNLINITIADVRGARRDDQFEGWIFKSTKYKTSIIYGTKIMVVPDDIYRSLLTYADAIGPVISDGCDNNMYLFTSSRANSKDGSKMDHSLISNGMSKSFQLAEVFENKSTRVSPSRLRCAVVTDLVGVGGENCALVAKQFMKHRETTSLKFYVSHWATVESMRLAMKCYGRFVSAPNINAVVKQREDLMQRPPPTRQQVEQWLNENNENIKTHCGNEVVDRRLMQCIGNMTKDNAVGSSSRSTEEEENASLSQQSTSSEARATTIVNVQDDWYLCKKRGDGTTILSRHQILGIVHVAQQVIKNPNIPVTRHGFAIEIANLKRLGYDNFSAIENEPWSKIKDVIRNMKRKYTNEETHCKFERFLTLAASLYLTDPM